MSETAIQCSGLVKCYGQLRAVDGIDLNCMEEAAALCDELAVIDRGKVIARGTPRALTDGLGNVQFLEFDVDDQLDVSSLKQLEVVHSVRQQRARCRVELDRSLGALAKVIAVLDQAGVVPIGLSAHQATLDDVFLQLTGHRLEQEVANQGASLFSLGSEILGVWGFAGFAIALRSFRWQ